MFVLFSSATDNFTLLMISDFLQMNDQAVTYGGFWKRVMAYIVDILVISVPVTLLFGSGLSLGVDEQTPGTYDVHLNLDMTLPEFIIMLISWVYFAGLESSEWQGTVVKRLLGMRVTDMAGERISFFRATGRYLSKFISSALLMIGFIMVAFTEKKQGLHDMIAGTCVINKRHE